MLPHTAGRGLTQHAPMQPIHLSHDVDAEILADVSDGAFIRCLS
jgi:hypothetical protein